MAATNIPIGEKMRIEYEYRIMNTNTITCSKIGLFQVNTSLYYICRYCNDNMAPEIIFCQLSGTFSLINCQIH